ncbi:hypothetical protein BH20ACT13_BH20ACT13_20620 [soil metagenome]
MVLQQSRSYADDAVVAYHSRSAGYDDAVSPELVLVDPVLADWARSQLGVASDTLAYVDVLVDASRRASLARRSMDLPARRFPDESESKNRLSRGRLRSAGVAGGVACALAVALLAVQVKLPGTSAETDNAASEAPAAQSLPKTSNADEEPVVQPRADPTPPATRPQPQRFAWAPAPGATAYHVELFRGSAKVFEADTQHSAMTIPARWTFDRRKHHLGPGDYRWYVWPLVSGRRAARAIVQAKLVISNRAVGST